MDDLKDIFEIAKVDLKEFLSAIENYSVDVMKRGGVSRICIGVRLLGAAQRITERRCGMDSVQWARAGLVIAAVLDRRSGEKHWNEDAAKYLSIIKHKPGEPGDPEFAGYIFLCCARIAGTPRLVEKLYRAAIRYYYHASKPAPREWRMAVKGYARLLTQQKLKKKARQLFRCAKVKRCMAAPAWCIYGPGVVAARQKRRQLVCERQNLIAADASVNQN